MKKVESPTTTPANCFANVPTRNKRAAKLFLFDVTIATVPTSNRFSMVDVVEQQIEGDGSHTLGMIFKNVDLEVAALSRFGVDVNVSLVTIEFLGLNGIPDRETPARIQEYFQVCSCPCLLGFWCLEQPDFVWSSQTSKVKGEEVCKGFLAQAHVKFLGLFQSTPSIFGYSFGRRGRQYLLLRVLKILHSPKRTRIPSSAR